MVPFQVSSQRRSSSGSHSLSPLLACLATGGCRGSQKVLGGRIASIARRPWDGLGCWPVWRRCPLGGGGGGGVAARSGSCCWCPAFWSALAARDTGRGYMGWSGSCGSSICWCTCGRGAVSASRGVGCSARPVGGSGETVWLQCCGAVYGRVGDACGWCRARFAVRRDF